MSSLFREAIITHEFQLAFMWIINTNIGMIRRVVENRKVKRVSPK